MHNGNAKKRDKGTEKNVEEIMAENFQKLVRDTKPQTWEAQRISSMINTQNSIPRYIQTAENQ